jgi:hypothetical protein
MDSAGVTALVYVGTGLAFIVIALLTLIVITFMPRLAAALSGNSARAAELARLGHGQDKVKS